MRYRLALLFAGAALISKRGPNPDGYPKREISKRSACDARIGVEIVTQTEQKNPTHRSEFARGAHGSEGAAVRCRHWANGAVGTLIPKLRLHILQDRARNFPLLSQLMTGGAASRRLAVFVTIYAPLHLYYLLEFHTLLLHHIAMAEIALYLGQSMITVAKEYEVGHFVNARDGIVRSAIST